jgi:hypothetical protein
MYRNVISAGVLSLVIAVGAGAQDAPRRVRWSGNFQPVQIRSSSVGLRIQSRIYGTAELASAEGNANRTQARLRFTVQTQSGSFTVQWALLAGRCGSGSLPIVPIENFPIIEVGTNGRAQLDEELALELPQTGEYHVNVYAGGQNLDNVITCANLKRAS